MKARPRLALRDVYKRQAEGFAKMFGSYFPPEFSITEGNAWMSVANNSIQYVTTVRPGEDVAKLCLLYTSG